MTDCVVCGRDGAHDVNCPMGGENTLSKCGVCDAPLTAQHLTPGAEEHGCAMCGKNFTTCKELMGHLEQCGLY